MNSSTRRGRVATAGGEGKAHLLVPDEGAKPGQRVH